MPKVAPENTEQIAIRDLMTPVLQETLDKALNTLTERQRSLFTAHFLDGKTYFDLSLKYGIPEKSVGRIVNRARRGLKKVTSLREFLDIF